MNIVINATPKSKRPKGLPKRAGKKKANAESKYRSRKARAEARNNAQIEAAKRNRARGYTAWDEARAKRHAKRHP